MDKRFRVRAKSDDDRAIIAKSFSGGPHQSSVTHPDTYDVAVIVRQWSDHSGDHTGEAYILRGSLYPYCWDSTRFVKV